jgi:hypothetical protein
LKHENARAEPPMFLGKRKRPFLAQIFEFLDSDKCGFSLLSHHCADAVNAVNERNEYPYLRPPHYFSPAPSQRKRS